MAARRHDVAAPSTAGRAGEGAGEGEASSGTAPPGDAPAPPSRQDGDGRYLRAGRFAWATLGVLGLLALALFLVARLGLIVVPLVLALFPAALLWPLAEVLRRAGLPDALTALASLLTLLAAFALLVALVVPAVSAELPDLVESLTEGVEQVDALLREGFFGVELDGLEGLLEMIQERAPATGDVAAGAVEAVTTAVEVLIGFVLLIVALFFYLKDGHRMVPAVTGLLPRGARGHAVALGQRVWDTIGGFLRGQLLVALVDAVFIGLGLALLGVPLAFPLAVIVFVGGLFPIVGAFVSGLIAVLVALADAGFLIALAALGIVVAVQQIESNVLEPLVLGRVVRLHPLVIVVAITGGGIVAGVLGAFLAVPITAAVARAVEYVRSGDGERRASMGEPAGEEDEREEEGERPRAPGERPRVPGVRPGEWSSSAPGRHNP